MDDVTRRQAIAAATGVAAVGIVAEPALAQKEGEPTEGSEFIVKLSGVKLPREAEARINSAVQAAVMAELARLDLRQNNPASELAVRFPKEWLGLWLERLREPGIPNLRTQPVGR